MTNYIRWEYLIIIQARLGSTRFPNKVLQTVGGIPMVRRVWLVANKLAWDLGPNYMKVIVAWPERYPDLNENNVLDRFRRIINEFKPKYVIRLTADCPLLTYWDIRSAWWGFNEDNLSGRCDYYSNHLDGHDVQIFNPWVKQKWDREHVIADFTTPDTGLSVNTKKDLERVRKIWKEDKECPACHIGLY